MKMSTDIRVKTDPRYEELYKGLKLIGDDFHSIFFLCTCLGFYAQKKTLPTARRDERFWSRTITPDEWTVYYSIALLDKGEDFAALGDDAQVIAIAELYADAGMEILIHEVLQPYLTGEALPTLDRRGSEALAYELLKFVWDKERSVGKHVPASPP